MFLRDISGGAVTGTGTISVKDKGSKAIKVLLNTDGTNAGVVVIRKTDGNGDKLLDLSSKTPGDFPTQPILVDNTDVIYYSVSGTGASAQIFAAIG